MNLTITESPSPLSARLRAVRSLKRVRVRVGLPASAGSRLRFILAVQEHGSPAMHIPPRPAVAPALAEEETRAAMAASLRESIRATWEGDLPAARRALEQAGQQGADAVRARIDAGIPPPNSPVTVSGGWIRNPVSGKPVKIPGKGFDKPLVDTGELYRAIGYEIDET